MSKIDITSTTIEKGIDLIKDFLEKITGKAAEEMGEILADKIRSFRVKNQLKILSTVQKHCKENNIPLKQINIKTLVPLLEYASLEDDETIQEKWQNMIINFANDNEHYESSIFPFILNNLSSNEIRVLDEIYKERLKRHDVGIISGIEQSNLLRLGLIELDYSYSKLTNKRVYYTKFYLTDLGYEFIKCCRLK